MTDHHHRDNRHEAHPHADTETPLARLDRKLGEATSYRLVRPLIVGVVHGLAGSAAVALLVLAAIKTPLWSIAYLLIFGIGTIAGIKLIQLGTACVRMPRVGVYLS